MAIGLQHHPDHRKPNGDDGDARPIRLALLNGFELTDRGLHVDIPLSAQRLLAFLAFQERPLLRLHVAGNLWPDSPEARATANLRSSLWRAHQSTPKMIDAAGQHLRLAELVEVDVREVISLATRIVDDRSAGPNDFESAQQLIASPGDLLPDWYEDWVQFKREHLRQLRLHALEALCERLTRAGRYGMAVQSGLAAVACEPLRESSHRALMRAYAAEGNNGEALRQYHAYRKLLHQELHLRPSNQMEALIQQIRTAT